MQFDGPNTSGDEEVTAPNRRAPKPSAKEAKLLTRKQILGSGLSVQRYGRATLTIRRCGGLGELHSVNPLTQALAEYRTHRENAAEVASAFVAARIENHSPTFSWETADQNRLLEMVAAASTEPVFTRTDARFVADKLLSLQDEQRESLKKVQAQLARSMQPAMNLMSKIDGSSAGLARSLALKNTGMMKAVSVVASLSHSSGIARAISAMPRLGPSPMNELLKGYEPAALRLAVINVRNFGALDLSSVLNGIRTVSPATKIPRVLLRAADNSEIGISEIFDSSKAAATLARSLGDAEGARYISEAAADGEAVLASPEQDKILEAIQDLCDRMDKYQNDNLVLWVVSVYLTLYFALLFYLAPR